MANAFKDHPAVIAWQLGNEQEGAITRLCFNPACECTRKEWLKKTYRAPEEFNHRLNLVGWGMRVQSLDEVPQPAEGVEESSTEFAALSLAHRRLRRDGLLGYFALQAAALRGSRRASVDHHRLEHSLGRCSKRSASRRDHGHCRTELLPALG